MWLAGDNGRGFAMVRYTCWWATFVGERRVLLPWNHSPFRGLDGTTMRWGFRLCSSCQRGAIMSGLSPHHGRQRGFEIIASPKSLVVLLIAAYRGNCFNIMRIIIISSQRLLFATRWGAAKRDVLVHFREGIKGRRHRVRTAVRTSKTPAPR